MLEKALKDYEEKFGKPYPLAIGRGMTAQESINDIKRCIKTGKEAKEPDYDEDCDY